MGDVDGHKLHKFGKPFVQPEVIPPLHGHQVTKPLIGGKWGGMTSLRNVGNVSKCWLGYTQTTVVLCTEHILNL